MWKGAYLLLRQEQGWVKEFKENIDLLYNRDVFVFCIILYMS